MTPAEPIALVVFDMDGVLAHLDRARRLELLARFTGRSPEFLQAALWASDFERSAEAGAYVPGAAYLAELQRRIDADLTRAQWITARRDAMTPIAGTFEIARRLQRDTAIATLTNNGSLLKESIAEILPAAAELFGSAFHASFEFGARKPEPQVFTRMAEHCAVPPARILFVDDDAASIAGARSAGLQARLFRSPEDLAAQLRAFGLL